MNYDDTALTVNFMVVLLISCSPTRHQTQNNKYIKTHHSPPYSVPWIADKSGGDNGELSNEPGEGKAQLSLVLDHCAGYRVKETKVDRAINDDALDRRAKSSVQSCNAVVLQNLCRAVEKAGELAIRASSNVGRQPRSSKIERIHEEQRRRTGCTTRQKVSGKETPKLRVLVHSTQEPNLVRILKQHNLQKLH